MSIKPLFAEDIHSITPRWVGTTKKAGEGLVRVFLRASVGEFDRKFQYRILRSRRSAVTGQKRPWVLAVSESWSRDHLACAKEAILRDGFSNLTAIFTTDHSRIKFFQPKDLALVEVSSATEPGFYMSHTRPEGIQYALDHDPLYDPFFLEER